MTESVRGIQVVALGSDRGDEVTALMGRAFQNDPLFAYACPDASERARWMPWLFRWSAWLGFLFGQTLGTMGRLDGVAVTVGPDGGEFAEEQLAGFGYGQGREAVGAAIWDRANAKLTAALEPAHEALHQVMPEPHWLLDVIAVEPACQGYGVGRALLHAVNERADADGVPIALLTYEPTNLGFYHRSDYRVFCEGTVMGNDLHWWGMRRDPKI
jgi:ribosomal protein S18 acetylase RimI-like enzyme